jgi:hypothetical protein
MQELSGIGKRLVRQHGIIHRDWENAEPGAPAMLAIHFS